jgi:hypothetical protein
MFWDLKQKKNAIGIVIVGDLIFGSIFHSIEEPRGT